MSVNALGLLREQLYILRKAKFDGQRMANLLLIANDEKKHYIAILVNFSQAVILIAKEESTSA